MLQLISTFAGNTYSKARKKAIDYLVQNYIFSRQVIAYFHDEAQTDRTYYSSLLALYCHTTVKNSNDQLYALARTDIRAFALEVSKSAKSELGKAQAIVRWLAENFEWKATDYQKRSVQQIIEQKGGNCNELAMVALSAMKELNIKLRRVHEVNIHMNTPERGDRARALVKEKGNTYSVFGRRHNDHVWLELYDSHANEWFPADPSSGLVGVEEWMKGRVVFGKRFSLNPITEEMIVPFAVFAADADGKFTINRTQHYLVDEFDRLYDGKLHKHGAWKHWVAMLDLLDDKVAGAFAGSVNLHEYEAQIDTLATTYVQLRAFHGSKRTPCLKRSLILRRFRKSSMGLPSSARKLAS